nr:hypothetical protein [Streptomyces harenosi]
MPGPPRRIALVGPVASGKSTLAAAVAAHTGLPHIGLDDLFWGPDWTPVPAAEFRARVRGALAEEAWIADGNFGGAVAELLMARATLVIWLDLPLRVCLPRLVARSVRRAAGGQVLFAGNRETFRHLLGRESILWSGPAHHHRDRRRWAARLARARAAGRPPLRLTRSAAIVPALAARGLLPPGGQGS